MATKKPKSTRKVPRSTKRSRVPKGRKTPKAIAKKRIRRSKRPAPRKVPKRRVPKPASRKPVARKPSKARPVAKKRAVKAVKRRPAPRKPTSKKIAKKAAVKRPAKKAIAVKAVKHRPAPRKPTPKKIAKKAAVKSPAKKAIAVKRAALKRVKRAGERVPRPKPKGLPEVSWPVVKKPKWVSARQRRRREKAEQERFEAEERLAIQAEGRKSDFQKAADKQKPKDVKRALAVMNTQGVEWVRKDLRIAKVPTMLRHVPGSEGFLTALENAAGGIRGEEFYEMIAKLAKQTKVSFSMAWKIARDERAMGPFSDRFRDLALRIAQLTNMSVKEVYTLYFSP